MEILEMILLSFLVVCAVSVALSKNLLTSIVIFMAYSVINGNDIPLITRFHSYLLIFHIYPKKNAFCFGKCVFRLFK